MDLDPFREAVETAKETELDRLGSSKLLVALTDASLDPESVLAVAADSERAAADLFDKWVAEADEPAASTFADLAQQEVEHYDRVTEALPESETHEPSGGGAMHDYLANLTTDVERAAGVVGRCLVSLRVQNQVIAFFENEAKPTHADLFRDLKADTEDQLDRGLDLLDAVCETDVDRERAEEVACDAVQVAYDEYAAALRELGVDPKSIC